MRFLVKILDFLPQIYSDLCLADFGREAFWELKAKL